MSENAARTADLWNRISAELRRDTPEFSFHIWLAPLELGALDGATLHVRSPDHLLAWVRERYTAAISAAAARVLDGEVRVEIVGADWSAPPPAGAAAPSPQGPQTCLDPSRTFDCFVIGHQNRFAHAAALAVAELPGQAYNPLFLHGPPGLGKTHLLHAIGNFVVDHAPGLRVRYCTLEDFTADFVAAVRGRNPAPFKARYREVDVLLVDDVQFLSARKGTREEFFHTFNALHAAGRQVVLSSDRGPLAIDSLEDRLRERFDSGLVADLAPPDFATRLTILRRQARARGHDHVPDEALCEIALRLEASVRVLEAALVRVVAFASMEGSPVTPELAGAVLERLYPVPARSELDTVRIRTATAAKFGLEPDALIAADRRPATVLARQVAMYLSRELTTRSLPQLGAEFGGRHHSTILHAHRRVTERLLGDAQLRTAVADLRRLLSRDDRGG